MDKKQYGWAICMACALLLFCTAGLAQTGFSAYQPYLTRIGGLTNTQASTVVLFRNLFGLAGMLAVTPLIRRFEVRRIVTCGILLCGVSFLAYGFSRSFFGYCGAAALSGCALGLGCGPGGDDSVNLHVCGRGGHGGILSGHCDKIPGALHSGSPAVRRGAGSHGGQNRGLCARICHHAHSHDCGSRDCTDCVPRNREGEQEIDRGASLSGREEKKEKESRRTHWAIYRLLPLSRQGSIAGICQSVRRLLCAGKLTVFGAEEGAVRLLLTDPAAWPGWFLP